MPKLTDVIHMTSRYLSCLRGAESSQPKLVCRSRHHSRSAKKDADFVVETRDGISGKPR